MTACRGLDSQGRPEMFYGVRVHDQCYRRTHFDAGQFVESWDDEGARSGLCLRKMGCKGLPRTMPVLPPAGTTAFLPHPVRARLHRLLGTASGISSPSMTASPPSRTWAPTPAEPWVLPRWCGGRRGHSRRGKHGSPCLLRQEKPRKLTTTPARAKERTHVLRIQYARIYCC